MPQIVLDSAGEDLIAAFRDLRQLCAVVNHETGNGRRFSAIAFQTRVNSVQDRLLGLHGRPESSFSRCLRLSLLAFLTSTFQLSTGEASYPYLAECYRESGLSLESSTPISKNLATWFMMMGAISVVKTEEAWLLNRWRAEVSSVTTWPETRTALKSLLWIDAIHDPIGQELFEVLNCRDVQDVHLRNGTRPSCSRDSLWASGWAGNTYEVL